MNKKNPMKKSIVLISIFCLCFLFLSRPIYVEGGDGMEAGIKGYMEKSTDKAVINWILDRPDHDEFPDNPYSTYVPKTGDIWTMKIIDITAVIPVDPVDTWNISAWNTEAYDYTSLDPQQFFEFNISGYSFMEVFGNESNHGYNWKIIHQLFLFPYTVVGEEGIESKFADYYASTYDGVEGDYDIDTSDGDFHLNGTVNGEFEDSYFEIDCYLGIRERFVYKKKAATSAEYNSILNISLIDSYFPDRDPEIPGYTYLVGIGSIFIGVITIIVQRKITKVKTKKV